VTTRNDIIKHFKKLAEHSTFLQYAAESAERIGWALEVNLRDNRGRVILQLGSEPGVHWVSNLPGECVTGVAGSAPVPSGGYITEAAGRIDQAIRDWNALDSFGGVGPARAARRERAEAATAAKESPCDRFLHKQAMESSAIAELVGARTSPLPGAVVAESSSGFSPAFFGIDLGSKDGDVTAYVTPGSQAKRDLAELGFSATPGAVSEAVDRAVYDALRPGADPVATASLTVEAMEPVKPGSADKGVEFDYLGLHEKEGAYAWHWRQIMSRAACPFATTWVEDRHTTWSSTPPSERGWTLVKQP
jgi:hypothetical protein